MKKFAKDYLNLTKENMKFVKDHPVGTAVSIVIGCTISLTPVVVDIVKTSKLNERIKKVKEDFKNWEA